MAGGKISMRGLFVRELTVPMTVPGNSESHINIYPLINNDMPSGYKCYGIVGFGSGQQQIVVTNCRYIDHNWSFQLRNNATASQTVNATIYYLCGKL